MLTTQGTTLVGHVHRGFPLTVAVPLSGCPITAEVMWTFFFKWPRREFLELYCTQEAEAEKHEPVTSRAETLGLHRSFVVHLL